MDTPKSKHGSGPQVYWEFAGLPASDLLQRVPLPETREVNLLDLFNEPWYVIFGVLAASFVVLVLTEVLRDSGMWPVKSDNPAADMMVWFGILLAIGLLVLTVLFVFRLVSGTL